MKNNDTWKETVNSSVLCAPELYNCEFVSLLSGSLSCLQVELYRTN